MPTHPFLTHVEAELASLEAAGLTKREMVLTSPQGGRIVLADGRSAINLCSNNYLGLANHPALREAARQALEERGLGLASVRFICGTQDLHQDLEAKLASFLGTEATVLFSSCWDANGGVFEALLGPADAVVSDALNHASLIDGIRLCKARRYRFANADPADCEERCREARAAGARFVLIATDGVFSMDGIVAPLAAYREIANRYEALLLVDDSHATGVLGTQGRGSHEAAGLLGQVDILTGTFGKALGGASGGYVASSHPIAALLRQRARPYLFSNTLPPPLVAATRRALDLVSQEPERRQRLHDNGRYFRAGLAAQGWRLLGGGHPIVPVWLGEARRASRTAQLLRERGVFAIAFSYPVVPEGQARVRTQMSADLARDDLNLALAAFAEVKKLTEFS